MQQRADRLSSSIHKIAAEVLRGVTSDAYITVTRVDVSPDLHQALVWVSVYHPDQQESDIFSSVLEYRSSVRGAVAKQLHLRKVPYIEFKHDTSAAVADEINKHM